MEAEIQGVAAIAAVIVQQGAGQNAEAARALQEAQAAQQQAAQEAAQAANEEGTTLARQTVENMKNKLGYCESCAREVITFLMRQKY